MWSLHRTQLHSTALATSNISLPSFLWLMNLKTLLPQRRIQNSLQPWLELLHRETGPDTPNFLQEQREWRLEKQKNHYSPRVRTNKALGKASATKQVQMWQDQNKSKKKRKLHLAMHEVSFTTALKGPGQSHLCFCLHTRVWLLRFSRAY